MDHASLLPRARLCFRFVPPSRGCLLRLGERGLREEIFKSPFHRATSPPSDPVLSKYFYLAQIGTLQPKPRCCFLRRRLEDGCFASQAIIRDAFHAQSVAPERVLDVFLLVDVARASLLRLDFAAISSL